MSAILTTCPSTQLPVPTGHHATTIQFASPAVTGGRFRCPACNQIHDWAKDDAWLALKSAAPAPAPA